MSASKVNLTPKENFNAIIDPSVQISAQEISSMANAIDDNADILDETTNKINILEEQIQPASNGVIGFETKQEAIDYTPTSQQTPRDDYQRFNVYEDADNTNNGEYFFLASEANGVKYISNFLESSDIVDRTNSVDYLTGKAVADFFQLKTKPYFTPNIGDPIDSVPSGGSSWQNEESTFSAWGAGVGVLSAFNTISFKLRAWDVNNIPTQARVRIREVNQLGTILGNVLFDWSDLSGEDITIVFPDTIDTVSSLWFEVLTNGRIGRFSAISSADGSGNSPDRFRTGGSLDADVTFGTLTSTKPFYIRTFLTTGNEGLLATDEFNNLIKNQSLEAVEQLINKQRLVVNTPISESICSWQTESSTFSGWGWGVGVRPAFNSLRLRIRGFSESESITQVNVRVRENNHTGTILAQKIVEESTIYNENLIVDFDTEIDTATPLYVEYLTDGRIGRFTEGGNIDIGQGSTTTNYTTTKSLDALVSIVTSSNPQAPIFVEFLNASPTELDFTEKAVDLIGAQLDIVDTVRLNLPDSTSAIVGRPTQLFFRGMIESLNPYDYNIKVTGNVGGKQYPRYYQFTPGSAGTDTFTLTIEDTKGNVVATDSCSVVSSNVATSPVSLKRVLCVGDSLTSQGIWTGELLRMLTTSGGDPIGLNLSNIEFIGTVGSGANLYEGYGGKTWGWFTQETTSGDIDVEFTVASHDKTEVDISSIWEDSNTNQWRLETIISATVLSFSRVGHSASAPSSGTLTHVSGATNTSNVVYSSTSGGAVNPFWNTNTNSLDFQDYVTVNNFGSIDYVLTLLTWNGQSGGRSNASDHASLISDARDFIDQMQSDYPSAHIILCGIQLPSLNGGLGQNYGDANSPYGNYFDLVKTVNGLNLAYKELANNPSYSSFVSFVDLSIQFDNENNMPSQEVAVNLRSSILENRGNNGVHPSISGQHQIADAFLNKLNELL